MTEENKGSGKPEIPPTVGEGLSSLLNGIIAFIRKAYAETPESADVPDESKYLMTADACYNLIRHTIPERSQRYETLADVSFALKVLDRKEIAKKAAERRESEEKEEPHPGHHLQ